MRDLGPIWDALKDVKDPEIPTISLVDLGVITEVSVDDADVVHVRMTPTFVGCPAMEYMRQDVVNRLEGMGFAGIDVVVNFDVQWNTNLITEEGRERLKEHGLAPPPTYEGLLELDVLNDIACPFCGSRNTDLRSPFGSTLCRTIYYCRNCRQGFEGFKPL